MTASSNSGVLAGLDLRRRNSRLLPLAALLRHQQQLRSIVGFIAQPPKTAGNCHWQLLTPPATLAAVAGLTICTAKTAGNTRWQSCGHRQQQLRQYC
jgi:hypothetical protein